MTEEEQYEFDRVGYIVIENMLADDEVASLKTAVDALEEHAAAATHRSRWMRRCASGSTPSSTSIGASTSRSTSSSATASWPAVR